MQLPYDKAEYPSFPKLQKMMNKVGWLQHVLITIHQVNKDAIYLKPQILLQSWTNIGHDGIKVKERAWNIKEAIDACIMVL